LRYRLGALEKLPGVSIEPEPYALVPVPQEQKVDVGYATVSLPAGVPFDVFEVSSNGAVVIEPHKKGPNGSPALPGLYLNLPSPDEDRGRQNLSDLPVGRPGALLHDSFELETQVVSARPFSLWEMLGMGLRETEINAALLGMKGLLLANATAVGMGSTGQVKFIVMTYPRETSLWIGDRGSKCFQKIALFSEPREARAIVSAIVGGYKLHLAGPDEAVIKNQIKNAHIRIVP
jgi:hypothetical protein